MKAHPRNIFITGIGTGVGKTLVSSILVESLQADYWKPVQAGCTPSTDRETVRSLVSNGISEFFPESYFFEEAIAPHAAAKKKGISMSLGGIKPPVTDKPLVTEGAGGVLVPLNESEFIIDLAARLDAAVVLVVSHYLGSINHTLLSAEALAARKLRVAGYVISGPPDVYSEAVIASCSGLRMLFRVNNEALINRELVSRYAAQIDKRIFEK